VPALFEAIVVSPAHTDNDITTTWQAADADEACAAL
jgi:glutamate-1-semialdehyde aminotransferase